MDRGYCQLYHSQFASLKAVIPFSSALRHLVGDWANWLRKERTTSNKMMNVPELILLELKCCYCWHLWQQWDTSRASHWCLLSLYQLLLNFLSTLQGYKFFNFWEWRANRDSPYWEHKFGALKARMFPEKQQIGIYLIFMSNMTETMSIKVSTVHFS